MHQRDRTSFSQALAQFGSTPPPRSDFFWKLATLLTEMGRESLFLFSIGLLFFIGFLDLITGNELSFSIFYLAPISLVAWQIGWNAGIVLSVMGAIIWVVADNLSGHIYQTPLAPYWNALVRFGFFAIVSYVLSSLRSWQNREAKLSQFIVHDLRAPIFNISASLELLREYGIDDGALEYVELAESSAARMSSLVDSLLDLRRMEAGEMPLVLDHCSIQAILKEALQQLHAFSKTQQTRIDLESAVDFSVLVDHALIVRVFVNIVSNAIKFSPTGSVVHINLPFSDSSPATISVRDEGHGIPPELCKKIFDPFFQVDSNQMNLSGSGLGLTFCREAIALHGGSIQAISDGKKGTTFVVELPSSSLVETNKDASPL